MRKAIAIAIAVAVAALLLVLGAAALWVRHPRGGGDPRHSGATEALDSHVRSGSSRGNDGIRLTPNATAAASGAASADALLTPDLALRLESLLLQAGSADTPALLKQRAAALVARHFPPELVVRATQLLDRYVDYRVALSQLKRPDMSDPRALREALQARQRVRQQHFTEEEAEALFAQDEELDRFTIARLEILRNAELTPVQKQAALHDAERELGEAQRALRSDAMAHEAVAAQTAAFDTAAVGEHERYRQRSASLGAAAAQRLAELDREEADWQARLARYSAAQSAHMPADQLEALRQQLFTPQEQLRLDGALALRSLPGR